MLPAGITIGTYRVLGQIGEGGMGTVYLGEHTLLGRRAAIKLLLPELSANAEIVKRFFNEARAVTQIADPGIVQVFDFGYHSDGGAFIVMELLDGEPMDKRLARVGRMSVAETLHLMRLVCASLAVAHARGIVHRDLKPENIFIVGDPAVTGGERPKILDFGIAKLSSDEPGSVKTRTGLVMGTPVYMSPEQCRSAAEVDHRSDIYAIGCVMFTMLTGRPPFEGQGSGDLIAMHIREPAPLAASRVPHLPPVIDQILQRCLCKSPDERFPSMTTLMEVLKSVAEHASSPGRVSQVSVLQPTIVPVASAPTTLSGATGQTGQTELVAHLRGRWWMATAVTVVAFVGVAVAVVVPRGESRAGDASHAMSTTGSATTSTAESAMALAVGATTSSATTVTAGTTVMPDATIATSRAPVDARTVAPTNAPPNVPIDATLGTAMIDAPVAPVDAVTSTIKRSSTPPNRIDRHRKPEPSHEAAQPPRYDRGD